jgi:hypothetical protein
VERKAPRSRDIEKIRRPKSHWCCTVWEKKLYSPADRSELRGWLASEERTVAFAQLNKGPVNGLLESPHNVSDLIFSAGICRADQDMITSNAVLAAIAGVQTDAKVVEPDEVDRIRDVLRSRERFFCGPIGYKFDLVTS